MGWLSDLLSDDGSGSAEGGDRDPRVRTAQLRKGVEAAAAALDDRHPGVARDAVEAADRLVERLPGTDPGLYDRHDPGHERPEAEGLEGEVSGGDRARELAGRAVERLDRLHFRLLRISVRGVSPEEAGIEEALEGVREMAGELTAGAGEGGG